MKVAINLFLCIVICGFTGAALAHPTDPNLGVLITVLVALLFGGSLVEYWTRRS